MPETKVGRDVARPESREETPIKRKATSASKRIACMGV